MVSDVTTSKRKAPGPPAPNWESWPVGRTFDANGNALTFRRPDGYWRRWPRNAAGHPISYQSRAETWIEWTRDEQGDADGEWTVIARWMVYDLMVNGFPVRGAIKHWFDRDDDRAIAFTAALLCYWDDNEVGDGDGK
jgi:hypothetical protein